MQRTANPRPSQILAVSTLAFAACFAVWTFFSIIGIGIKEQLSGIWWRNPGGAPPANICVC